MIWDDRVSGWLAKTTERYYVHVLPMIFNHRITLTMRTVLDAGQQTYIDAWCYPDRTSAELAAARWDPEAELEPKGWHKHPFARDEGPARV